MKRTTLIASSVFAGVLALGLPSHAAGKIRVVTTLTDLAEWTHAVGGDQVDVNSLCSGVEDTHGVPMRPSFLPLLHRADLVVLIGLECEHAFLPALLDVAKNPKIMPGTAGYVDCSVDITPAEVPRTLDRSEGDVHPSGNPHYNLDPVLAKTAIRNIYNALVGFAPTHKAEFAKNRDAYIAKLDGKIAEWQQLAKPLKGVKFISYHNHWPYFAERYGLQYAGTIEVKAGIDATPRHITELIEIMKKENVKIVVREPQFPEKLPKEVAARTGAELIKLPIMVNGVPEAKSYIEMLDYIIHTFVNAAQKMHVVEP